MWGKRTVLDVTYNQENITNDLSPNLLNWTFTDNLSGQIDDIQLSLEDKAQLWSNSWMPQQGDSLQVTIKKEYWDDDVTTLNAGMFEIDEIEVNGPPSTVTVKGLSVPETSSLRGENKNRAWEKATLSVVARDISNANNISLYYETSDDPEQDRLEQTEESDLNFLLRICNDAGLCLKVANNHIVIFDEAKYEQADPIETIVKGEKDIKSYGGRITVNGIYKSCRVEHHDSESNQTISYTFTPPNPPNTNKVLVVNESVKSVDEARRLAIKKLREQNKNAVTYSLTIPGDLRYAAGLTVNLKGFGKFDGKYIITQATHGDSGGYETKIDLRKCLEGY